MKPHDSSTRNTRKQSALFLCTLILVMAGISCESSKRRYAPAAVYHYSSFDRDDDPTLAWRKVVDELLNMPAPAADWKRLLRINPIRRRTMRPKKR